MSNIEHFCDARITTTLYTKGYFYNLTYYHEQKPFSIIIFFWNVKLNSLKSIFVSKLVKKNRSQICLTLYISSVTNMHSIGATTCAASSGTVKPRQAEEGRGAREWEQVLRLYAHGGVLLPWRRRWGDAVSSEREISCFVVNCSLMVLLHVLLWCIREMWNPRIIKFAGVTHSKFCYCPEGSTGIGRVSWGRVCLLCDT